MRSKGPRLGGFLRPTPREQYYYAGGPGQVPLPRNASCSAGKGTSERLRRLLVGLDELSGFLVRGDRGKLAVALGSHLTQPGDNAAGTRRDQATDDHILLEAGQRIDPSGHRSLGEDARRLLERGCRDERARL